MKNITVSVDDETYRRARLWAAERDTSVSAIVKCILVTLPARTHSKPSTPRALDSGRSTLNPASLDPRPSALDPVVVPSWGLSILKATHRHLQSPEPAVQSQPSSPPDPSKPAQDFAAEPGESVTVPGSPFE
jgi:hypothetical protein